MDNRLDYYTYQEQIKVFLKNLNQKKILQIFLEHNYESSFFVQVTYNYVEKEYYIYFTNRDEDIAKDIKQNILSSEELRKKYVQISQNEILNEYFKKEKFSKYVSYKKIKKKDGTKIEDILKKDRLKDIEGPTNILNGWRYNVLSSYLGEKRIYSFQTYIEKGYEDIGKIIEITFSYLPEEQRKYGSRKIQYKV